ncbi:type IV secretory system conjugative DNA transfer family protein [Vibrio harveyi]|uniref:type IV secretory system conjugative DNA transfer family protein n=1 Tax=Vibrio harveyi TaxID=669 RepID=UPI00248118BD|nr:type IV secretory system conjugative DNA transfer family protein [Vibrio harveyi]
MHNKAFSLNLILSSILLVGISPFSYASDKVLDKDQISNLTSSNEIYLEQAKKKEVWQKKQINIAGNYGFNHGYITEMKYLEKKMMERKSHWDVLFSFKDLSSLLSNGAAKGLYLIGGVVDEVDSSVKTINDELIIAAGTRFKIRKYPRLAPSPPHWYDYLFKKENMDLSPPAKSILPKNANERAMWKRAIDTGWERGVESARAEFRKRYQHLFADLIGITNYWYLVEIGMITEVNVGTTNYYLQHRKLEDGEELTFNPTAIQINTQSEFVTKPELWHGTTNTSLDANSRSSLRDAIVTGDTTLQDVIDNDVTIYTTEHEQLIEQLRDEQFEHIRTN